MAAGAPPQNPAGKLRWGELEEDDADDFAYLLPPPVVIGPDENGVKKVVEYRFNDEGEKVKVTTITRTGKLARARLSKKALGRRSRAKFGDAVREEVGNRLTMVSTEEILIERTRSPGMAEEVKTPDPLVAAAAKAGAVLMVCRTCHKKGDHWTAQCPYKDLAAPTDAFIDRPPASEAATPATGGRTGAYVPPGMRGGGGGERSVPDRRGMMRTLSGLQTSQRIQGSLTCLSFSAPLALSAVYMLLLIRRLESAVVLGLSTLSIRKMQRGRLTSSMVMVMIILSSESSGPRQGPTKLCVFIRYCVYQIF